MNLVWTDAKTRIEQRAPFTGGIVELVAKVDEQLRIYAQEAPDRYPGMALEISEEASESLAFGVTPDGWSLVLWDGDDASWRTAGDEEATGSYAVVWSVPDDLPASWFVPREAALGAVECWLRDQSMDTALEWVANG
ncbi:Imm1 family immunity protein [Kineosporia sp. NBRC 101731]|uniref:Imm1 family immunity protein n=1 Tax=Kineosporia sp. NBRC 101731 TaxID=3032199 RepID=UPI0024A1CDBF|nr:Imm1 family immunity protein [Kineosporia sp. NBRC 101731]GLY29797.1 hypothetical protein Kisp02_31620 [Kineosporia sp. NBRC 101731]